MRLNYKQSQLPDSIGWNLDYSFTSQCVSSGGKLIKNISFLFCRGERRKSEGGEIRQSEHMLQKIISARF